MLAVAYGTTGSHLIHLYNASGMRGCGNRPVCLSRASTFIDAMKADHMKGDAMKGDAMKADHLKGDAMKGDAMKNDK